MNAWNGRSKRWRAVLVLARILPAFGCGGSLTSATSIGAPSAITVVSGDTGAPVAGAQVTVGGRSATTSARGEVQLEGAGVVRIESVGFLQRETVLGGTGALSLWPVRSSY